MVFSSVLMQITCPRHGGRTRVHLPECGHLRRVSDRGNPYYASERKQWPVRRFHPAQRPPVPAWHTAAARRRVYGLRVRRGFEIRPHYRFRRHITHSEPQYFHSIVGRPGATVISPAMQCVFGWQKLQRFSGNSTLFVSAHRNRASQPRAIRPNVGHSPAQGRHRPVGARIRESRRCSH